MPKGWNTEISVNGAGSLTVAEVSAVLDKSVNVINTGTTNNNTYASRTFSLQSGIVVTEFKMRADQTDKYGRSIYLYDSSNTVAVMTWFNSAGYIQYRNGTSWVNAQSYSSGLWYDIKIVANTDTDTYDLYINGILKKAGASFTNEVDDISKFQTGVYTAGASMNFDTVKILH